MRRGWRSLLSWGANVTDGSRWRRGSRRRGSEGAGAGGGGELDREDAEGAGSQIGPLGSGRSASARTCWGAISPKPQEWANLSQSPPNPEKVTEGEGEGEH